MNIYYSLGRVLRKYTWATIIVLHKEEEEGNCIVNHLLEHHIDYQQICKSASPFPHAIRTFEVNFQNYLHKTYNWKLR